LHLEHITEPAIAERMRIANNGNVGIGTTAPTEKLDVVGNTIANNHYCRYWFRNTSANYGLANVALDNQFAAITDADWIITGAATACGLAFGTPDHLTKWGYVYGESSGVGILNNSRNWALKNPTGTTNIQILGNLGVGVANPSYPIHSSTGAFLSATGVWTNASDSRLKNSIKPMTNYGLSEILKLEPVTYYYNIDSAKTHKEIGFIAQDIQKIVPEIVYGKEGEIIKGETLGLSYGNLVPVIVNAIKEQQVIITNQQTLINNQQSAIENQQAQIDELKKMVDILLVENKDK